MSTGSSSRAARRDFQRALVRLVLDAARLLGGRQRGVGARELVHYLRGARPLQAFAPHPPARGNRRGSSYGLLEAVRSSWLERLVEGLAEEGYFELAPNARARWRLSAAGRSALDDDAPLTPHLLPRQPRLGDHAELEEALRTLRRRLADRDGRTPYAVFPNATLAALAAARPQDLAALGALPGMGETRVRRYGRSILAVLRKAREPE